MFYESSELTYMPEDEAGEESYDHRGRITMRKVKVRGGLMTLRYEYPDENANKPSRIRNLSPDGSLLTVRDFSYNEDGDQTAVIEKDPQGKLLYSETRTFESGTISSRDIVYGGNPDQHIYYKVTRDDGGNVKEEEVNAL